MKRVYYYLVLIICVIGIIVIGYFCWHAPVTAVVIVRHAEKATTPPTDPSLSQEGMQRAQTLAHVVEDVGIDVIFATQYQRTQATVAPAASNLDLIPIIVPAANTEELVNMIISDYKGLEILIAGHSNTVTAIIESLGILSAPSIAENEYDNLFIIHNKTKDLKYKF